ncbi:MAG: sodium-dependent transporter, partial [Oscillospiraceae bacterium]|nr:sodium-dependent transporter [Oscillospiraceae bacterium]
FIILITSVPCALSYNVLSNVHLIGPRDILDSEDFIVSNLLLPIGALIYLLFCVTRFGWGYENFLKEANTGEGPKLSAKLRPYFLYVLPVLILIIFIGGLI